METEKNYPMAYAQQKAAIDKERELNKQQFELEKIFKIADVFINKDYLDFFHNADLIQEDTRELCDDSKLRIIELTKLVFDEDENINDKLAGVYNALYNLEVTLALYVVGSKTETKVYFVTRSNTIAPLAGEVLEAMLRGSFPGIEIRALDFSETKRVLDNLEVNEYGEKSIKGLATVNMVPSERNNEKKEKQFVQGLEKFIDTMQRKEYVAIFLAVPLKREAITIRKHGLEEMYSILSPHVKLSMAYGENVSVAVNKGVSKSFSESINESITNTNSTSSSYTSGTSTSRSSGSSFGGGSSGEGSSSNWGFNSGTSDSTSSSYASGTSFSNSISKSLGASETTSVNEGVTDTTGKSLTHTINFDNKDSISR